MTFHNQTLGVHYLHLIFLSSKVTVAPVTVAPVTVAHGKLPNPLPSQDETPAPLHRPKALSAPFEHLAKLGTYEWELLQPELLAGIPEETWGLRPCCNFDCTRLEGPCEMAVETQACGGGCGARYCCVECQEQSWRGGHSRNCAVMRSIRERG